MSALLPIVVAELELRDVERHVFLADLVERADHTALEDRPEALKLYSEPSAVPADHRLRL